jgi:hypothetical protein
MGVLYPPEGDPCYRPQAVIDITMPWMKNRLRRTKSRIVGTEVKITAVMIQGMLPPPYPDMVATATMMGRTFFVRESTMPKSRSFQIHVAWKRATTAVGDSDWGRKMERKERTGPHPSSFAASSISRGMVV